MNHRIFERTLRPVVFRRACLFERHFSLKPLGLVLSDTLSQTKRLLEMYRRGGGAATDELQCIRFYQVVVSSEENFPQASPNKSPNKFDLKSGRITR